MYSIVQTRALKNGQNNCNFYLWLHHLNFSLSLAEELSSGHSYVPEHRVSVLKINFDVCISEVFQQYYREVDTLSPSSQCNRVRWNVFVSVLVAFGVWNQAVGRGNSSTFTRILRYWVRISCAILALFRFRFKTICHRAGGGGSRLLTKKEAA